MVKKLKYLSFLAAMIVVLTVTNCGAEEDINLVCAGCPDDAPWSVAGSSECYEKFENCDASETGDCVICN